MLEEFTSRSKAMKFRLLRLRRKVILTSVFAMNIVCFMFISYQNLRSWGSSRPAVEVPSTTATSTVTTMVTVTTMAAVNTTQTLSPLLVNKIIQIKLDLNDTQLTNEVLYPGRRVGRYVMIDTHLCKRGVDYLDIIIIVHTAPGNVHRRQRIRETFGNETLFLPFHVRVAFLLGKTQNKTLETVLWFEHATYRDTVMGDFLDDYHNLSLKGAMGYRWVSQHCSNSRYVLKMDDDVIVNMFKLLYSFYNHMNGKRKSIFCNLWFKGTMPILRQGKWKVESNIFAKYDMFPFDYCSGFVVIMTSDLMGPMYEAARTTPFFWIDDVYLFGMLPHVVGGVTYYNYAIDRNLSLREQDAINCTKLQGPRCPIVASVSSDGNFWGFWNLIKNIYSADSSWQVENKIVV
ncbi:Beta-1,3-galactosyltransferase 1 [Bulinus truncatus]|nr:Beta-1,3-galactosyltransferase 1 [Bulinus truncatus]